MAEILYNQDGVSERMWNLYLLIIDAILNNKGVLDEVLHIACVSLINFINKAPEQFRDMNLNGYGSPLELMINTINKIF